MIRVFHRDITVSHAFGIIVLSSKTEDRKGLYDGKR
jgi:hypothetical protein